jgi:3-oxoadipate enol-lactonase
VIRIAHESNGEGPPLLLIQGLGYPRWGWEPLAAPLAKSFRVITFDNRGIGESETPRGPYTTRMLAEDAVGVLDSLGIERAHVCGASLGGMVAQEVAVGWPERVDRLVLFCTTPGNGAFPMPKQTVQLFEEAWAMPPEVAIKRFTENSLATAGPIADEIARRRIAEPPNREGWLGQVAAGTNFQGVDLAAIRARTLVLHGTEDNVIDVRNAGLLAERVPSARLVLMAGVGHMFWWEQPERVVTIVREFLS